jgi:hypothetical protein
MAKQALAMALAAALPGLAGAQAPPVPPAQPPAAAAPAASYGEPQTINDTDSILLARLPAENPFGAALDAPAVLPVKPVIPKVLMSDEMYLAIRIDAKGKPVSFRKPRDPIPSLAADVQKSVSRWTFDPGKKGGQPVETWTVVKLDLSTEVDPLKMEQVSLSPVTRETPIPTPFEWPAAANWVEAQKAIPPSDETVPFDQVDTPPSPRKTHWSADSYERPITVKLWVRVTTAGKVDRIVPIQVPDPFLIGYLKKGLASWTLRPARAGNASVESWNELAFSGEIDCSIELKQIVSLKKSP